MLERFTKSARAAVMHARELAVGSADGRIGCEHLLVGLAEVGEPHLADAGLSAGDLRAAIDATAGSTAADAQALGALGIDLEAIRDRVEQTFGPRAWDDAAPAPRENRGLAARLLGRTGRITPAGRKVLELGLREALADDAKEITTTHLLRGLLRAPGDRVTEIVPADVLTRLREETRRRAA